MPNSFIFDPNRCTGCGACRLACGIENGLEPEASWRRIETFNDRRHPVLPVYHLSLACNHCADAVCMKACPAVAYRRDEQTGAVLLDEDRCIGCRYCSWACPYDAPVFDRMRGVMSKCTLCVHRLGDGRKPACVALCPTGALDFADLPESELVNEIEGFPSTDLGPRVRIVPLKAERMLPVMSAPVPERTYVPDSRLRAKRVSLASEWPLMVFTVLTAALVALVVAGAVTGRPAVGPLAFAGLGALAMGLGALHLGRPARAYRAVLNLRHSWLSREIVLTSVFLALGTGFLWLSPDAPVLSWVAALMGFAALVSADRVYGVLGPSRPAHQHSAGVLWMGLLLAAVFSGAAWAAGLLGLGTLLLYAMRKQEVIAGGGSARPLASAVRVGVGLVLPLALWLVDYEAWHALIAAATLLGAVIDRGEYYAELEADAPARRMAIELEKAAAYGQTPRSSTTFATRWMASM